MIVSELRFTTFKCINYQGTKVKVPSAWKRRRGAATRPRPLLLLRLVQRVLEAPSRQILAGSSTSVISAVLHCLAWDSRVV